MSDNKLNVVLELDKLTVSFDDDVVVSNVSLSIHKNEILGLVGETKAGKSVLARAILDAIPFPGRIINGDVRLFGSSVLKTSEEDKRQYRGGRVALIGTNPKALLNPVERIGNQVATVVMAHRKVARNEANKLAIKALSDVGIINPELRARAYPHELSGGMAQRVVIAMALVSDPDVVLADDATLGLDATVQVQVLDLLVSSCKQRGLSVLLITHDLGIVANYCNRVAIMQNGTIIEVGNVDTFFDQPKTVYGKELLEAAEVIPAFEFKEIKNNTTETATNVSNQIPIMQVENLVKHFYLGKNQIIKAIDDVSFQIYQGETLALVGESGSGKTTVAQCILRLIDQTSGIIRFNGQIVSDLNENEFRTIRRKLQMIFQESYVALNPRWKVRELISEPLKLIPEMTKQEKVDRVFELLSRVHLSHNIIDAYPHQLTAGEQKRVGIARGLVTFPDFIIFDESTTGLDIQVRAQIIGLIKELQNEFNITALYITHDLNSVRFIAHRVAVMCQGKIVEIGQTHKIFETQEKEYTKMLLEAELPIKAKTKDSLQING